MSLRDFSKGWVTSFQSVLENCPACIGSCTHLCLEKQIINLYKGSQFLRMLSFYSKLYLSQYIMKAVRYRIKAFTDLRINNPFLKVRKTEDPRRCELFKGNVARQSSWEQNLSLLLLSFVLRYHENSWSQMIKHKAKLGAYINCTNYTEVFP